MKSARPIAEREPVARLMIDLPLPHLDRPFDYLVPAELDEVVAAGSKVRVRFAGRLVDGYVIERRADSTHESPLAPLERAIGTIPALTAETAQLFRAVADRYGGSFVDVARLGVPARHARAEAAPAKPAQPLPAPPDPAGWARYSNGAAFLAAVGATKAARAVWSALPSEDWPLRVAELMQATLAAGRGAVVVLPDVRDLARVDEALTKLVGPGQHVALSADLGPARRYGRWLAARRGEVHAVVGARAAAYAPVANLGLVVVWDDGDDLHREPRAPYPEVRDVLALRSAHTGAAMLIGGHARSVPAQQLLESGWAHEIVAARDTLRMAAPRVTALGDDVELARDPAARAARLPSLAWRAARDALASDAPVLVQVARAGYVPALACARDRTPARCASCAGPLGVGTGGGAVSCRWCGRPGLDWQCPACGAPGSGQ